MDLLDEERRLAALAAYQVLDSEPEEAFDEIVRLAARITGAPIALVSLIDSDRQWFKACIGIDMRSTPRSASFCAHTIQGRDPLVIDDATSDPRFADNPMVTGAPFVRSYAGVPLVDRDGAALGTLGVVDMAPRRPTAAQLEVLVVLAHQVVAQLELRRANRSIAAQLREQEALRAAAEEANRSKDWFLAAVSHDLRTPLGAILGWTTLLRGRPDDAALHRRAVEIIDRQARTQLRLVDDLLDVTRIGADRLEVDRVPFELSTVVEAALDTLRPTADARRVELTLELPGDPIVVRGEAGRVEQVVWNLVANAIKFSPDGARVAVRLERDGTLARLTVDDRGRGIAADLLPRIFEPFQQDGDGESRRLGGLGLGLTIASRIVAALGGTIRAHSDGRDRGARFVVELPAFDAPPMSTRGRPPGSSAPPAGTSGLDNQM